MLQSHKQINIANTKLKTQTQMNQKRKNIECMNDEEQAEKEILTQLSIRVFINIMYVHQYFSFGID